jgi:hypothetical protein
MTEASPTYSRTTCEDTGSAISSPESRDGRGHCDAPDGPTSARSGQARVPAKAKASQAKNVAETIQGTYGPTCFASSVPGGPLSSWESRLRERLARIGSTEFDLTWKVKDTPSGRPLSHLVPSTHRSGETGYGGSAWTTPTLHGNYNRKGASKYSGDGLATQMISTSWPTPKESDHRQGMPERFKGAQSLNGPRSNLNDAMVAIASWPTPCASEDNKSVEAHLAMKQRMGERDGSHANRTAITSLAVMMKAQPVAAWATPTARDGRSGKASQATHDRNARPLNEQMQATASGPARSASPATTAKRGAPNPAFPCWLMGFPEEWLWLAPSDKPQPRFKTTKR